MNRAAFIGHKMALAQGGPAEPKHFSEANHVARLERFDRHSHERSSADQILFGEVNVATDTTTFRAAGLTTKTHAAIVVKPFGRVHTRFLVQQRRGPKGIAAHSAF